MLKGAAQQVKREQAAAHLTAKRFYGTEKQFEPKLLVAEFVFEMLFREKQIELLGTMREKATFQRRTC